MVSPLISRHNLTCKEHSPIRTYLLVSLSGVSVGTTTLGSFSGSTISDNTDVKCTPRDRNLTPAVSGGGGTVRPLLRRIYDLNSSHHLTFVSDNNTSKTQEDIKTDATLTYNPSTNILTVGGSGHIGNVVGDIIGDVTGMLPTW